MGENHNKQFASDLDAVYEVNDYLYFYSDMLTPEATQLQVDFLSRELGFTKPLNILDLACGHGRHSNLLAGLGHAVIGVDSNSAFLEIANADARSKGVDVTYFQQDMRELTSVEMFDCVLFLFSSFGHFADEDNAKVIGNISRALKQNGLLCLDIPNRDAVLKHWSPYMVRRKANDFMIDCLKYDIATGRIYNDRVVIREGITKEKPFFWRLYSLTELRTLLASYGLQVIKVFADWEGSALKDNSRRMIVIAEKK